MAQAQLVRPKLAAVIQQEQTLKQKQSLHQEQSLQVVQTLLGASIGSLAFIRGLFPDECFTKMRYEPEYTKNYRAFSTGAAEAGRRGQGVKVTRLQKGINRFADRLLDYLETGVFQALKDGYLKALQLGIYTDENRPEQVAESYTFSFLYHGQEGISLHVKNLAGREVVIADAHKRVQQVTRNLLAITEALHALPGTLDSLAMRNVTCR